MALSQDRSFISLGDWPFANCIQLGKKENAAGTHGFSPCLSKLGRNLKELDLAASICNVPRAHIYDVSPHPSTYES